MRKLSTIALVCLMPAQLNAQAFGVNMGEPVSKYGGRPTGQSKYQYKISVPLPNREFESYVAYATPETGICKVSGIGRDHENDDYGSEVRSSYASLRSALTAKYGASKSFDFIKSGALWDEPREFVWSIYKDERSVASYWDRDEGSAIPSDIEIIGLQIKSVSSRATYISLAYEFRNMERCNALGNASENRGL